MALSPTNGPTFTTNTSLLWNFHSQMPLPYPSSHLFFLIWKNYDISVMPNDILPTTHFTKLNFFARHIVKLVSFINTNTLYSQLIDTSFVNLLPHILLNPFPSSKPGYWITLTTYSTVINWHNVTTSHILVPLPHIYYDTHITPEPLLPFLGRSAHCYAFLRGFIE